jgi:uncharacterized protein (DUF2249 family)
VHKEGKAMSSAQHPSGPVVDVRSSVARERHPLIFNTFHAFEPGQYFILVNDHNPKPLFYQFQAEHRDTLTWDCLDQGPDVWRVRISRTA